MLHNFGKGLHLCYMAKTLVHFFCGRYILKVIPKLFVQSAKVSSLYYRKDLSNKAGRNFFFFERYDLNTGWDGTFKGKPLNEGVYVYIIDAVVRGKYIFLKGNVSLIRN